MIHVNCRTNLDICEEWPTILPCRPLVGDIIKSKRGLELKVVQIIFDEFGKRNFKYSFQQGGIYTEKAEVSESVLLVELHLPDHRFESIAKFNEWYTRHKQESLR